MEWTFADLHTSFRVSTQGTDNRFTVRVGTEEYRATVLHFAPPRLTLLLDEHHVIESDVEWQRGECRINLANVPYHFTVTSGVAGLPGQHHQPSSAQQISAPLPGRIVDVLVAVGDHVQAGQPVCIIEAMKMQNEICAPAGGIVATLSVAVGAAVEGNAVLLTMTPAGADEPGRLTTARAGVGRPPANRHSPCGARQSRVCRVRE